MLVWRFMRKRIALSIIALLPPAAWAAPLSFSPDCAGSPSHLSCRLNADKLGNIVLRNGFAVIRGNAIDIEAASDMSPAAQPMLTGIVVRVEADTDSLPGRVTGIAYFLSGKSLAEIDDPGVKDVIFKRDGATTGRIAGVQGYELQVIREDGRTEPVDISTIKFVRSPRAFVFTIPLSSATTLPSSAAFKADAAGIAFRPTSTQRSLPLSSILPQRPPAPDGSLLDDAPLSKFGEGATPPGGGPLYGDPDYDDPISPVFKWGPQPLPGMPARP